MIMLRIVCCTINSPLPHVFIALLGCMFQCTLTFEFGVKIQSMPFSPLPLFTAVDGGWSSWTDWGQCSVTCAEGVRLRHRSCDHPSPQRGGSDCPGNDVESMPCVLSPCPGNCRAALLHHRSCDHPSPQRGGADCPGTDVESMPCVLSPCPGKYRAALLHHRSCDHPNPQRGGHDCPCTDVESMPCVLSPCPGKCRAALLHHRSCDYPRAHREGDDSPGTGLYRHYKSSIILFLVHTNWFGPYTGSFCSKDLMNKFWSLCLCGLQN